MQKHIDCYDRVKPYQNSKTDNEQNVIDKNNLSKTGSALNQLNVYKQHNINSSIKSVNSTNIMLELTNEQKINIKKLLSKYSKLFSTDRYDVGSIENEFCKVNLSSKIPIYMRPYRCSLKDQQTIDQQIKMLLNKNMIKKSNSAYAFPVTLANKKDDGERSRLCIDLRKLNQNCIPDNFPFPRIEDIIDKLHDSMYFSTIDITSGFWHVKIDPKDTHKLGFVTVHDHYEWLVLPFGFKNASAIFQRIIYNILYKHDLTKFCHNYLDDIMIHSKDFETHIKHVELVLIALQKENIKLKLSKCKFFQTEVCFLGHKISLNSVKPLHDNIKAITDFPIPKTVKQLQEFLGKVNYYHKFIENAPKILAPLYALLKKETKFDWSAACQKSFDAIKHYLTTEPILCIYNPNEECFLFVDASKYGIGAVLKQFQSDKILKPIAYFSKKLLKYQQNYDITELECLAIKEAVEYFHHYLYGNKFTVITDHNALRWLSSVKHPNTRLFNWSLKLSQYNFDTKYLPGKHNVEADTLSRNPIDFQSDNKTHIKIVNLLCKNEILKEQKIDYDFSNLPKGCVIENELITKIKNSFHKVLVPKRLRVELVKKFHLTFGHIGVKQMLTLISKSYYWPEMTKLIKQFIDSCEVCMKNKTSRAKKLGLLSQLGPAKDTFDIISIDTVGGFNGYNSTKQYMHIAIDHFSRFTWTLASKTQSAKDFINLINQILSLEKPKIILADRYPGIKSKEFIDFLKNKQIEIIFIAVGCSQSNGICERVNQTLVNRMRCKMNESDKKVSWPKILKQTTDEYNMTPHSVTSFSPKFLLLGIKTQYENEMNIKLDDAKKIAFHNSQKGHEQNKKYYDSKHKQMTFKENDLVLVQNKNPISRRKLESKMLGPFKIIKKNFLKLHVIECDKKGRKSDVFHISMIKPFKTFDSIT